MNLIRTILVLSAIGLPAWSAESDRVTEDEATIRQNIDAYVAAFNVGDAAALADFWAEKGIWISPEGDRIEGRAAILESMSQYFSEGQKQQLTIRDMSVRFLAPTVAIEEGKARVVREGEAPTDTSYVAIHVKENDQWKLDTVREVALPTPTSHFEHLKALEWMIGTWVDQGDAWTIETKCQWTKNKNFMTRSFRVTQDNESVMEGTQVVGFDAAAGQIRSWLFDSDGGIGEGTWSQHDNRWVVETRHILPTGETGSSVNVLTYVDDNTMKWQSTGREIAGRMMPDIEPITIVRKED
jgi:uncharacterized protein (TIGR02246 family)